MAKVKDGNAKIVSFQPQPGQSAHYRVPTGSYYELACAHIAAHDGKGFVIERGKDEHRQQWRAWMAYFRALDDQTWPRGHKQTTFDKLAKIIAPTAWPVEFDASAPPSQPLDPPEAPVSAERRKQLADMLRGLVADVEVRERRAPRWPRWPRWCDMTRVQAQDRLTTLTADYAGKTPAVATPAMAAYLERMRAEMAEVEF